MRYFMDSSVKTGILVGLQILVGFVIGAVVACSPTKFSNLDNAGASGPCSTSTQNCIHTDNYNNYSPTFKVGSGKVDILFVADNSASMSFEQRNMAAKFGGFVESLDNKEIDYRIGITTTDLQAVNNKSLVGFGNGKSILTRSDSNRVGLFNAAIVRSETVACESFMKSMINTFGSNWRTASDYQNGYSKNCPSPDERGIYTSFQVLNGNSEGLVREDANLNIILISDEDVRSGNLTLEQNDKYDNFISMMSTKYPSKYWEFNSIIVKDNNCAAIQSQQILDQQGQSAVGSTIGMEYAKLSNSAAKDIDGNPRPRGKILDICQSDYSQHFSTIATQIAESSRLFSLECKPDAAPVVTAANGSQISNLYTWDGDRKLVFQRGSEGIQVNIKYRCYTGVK